MKLSEEEIKEFIAQERRNLIEVPLPDCAKEKRKRWLAVVDYFEKGIEKGMNFAPKNRRLHVRRIGRDSTKKEKRQDGIILPDDVSFEKPGNELYCVVSKASDVTLDVQEGDYIIVEKSMVEEHTFRPEKSDSEDVKNITFLTIQENYVIGVVSSWEEKEKETT